MANTHIEITQRLLDKHQPGKDAKAVLARFGLDLVRNEAPDVIILKDMLYDAFVHTDFSERLVKHKGDINKPTYLLKELLFRYLKALGPDFIHQSKALFDQAKTFRGLVSNVERSMKDIERKKGFQALHQDGARLIEEVDPLLRAVYLMGDANRILHDSGGMKIRELCLLENPKGIPGFDGEPARRINPFKLPNFEEIEKRMAEAREAVDRMSDKELSIRLLNSFNGSYASTTDVEYPVYGVETIYAFTPIIIDRLMNGWECDNKAHMDGLSSQMTEATVKLKNITRRLERVTTPSMEL